MPIVYGPVKSKKLKKGRNENVAAIGLKLCHLCKDIVDEEDLLICLNNDCQTSWHVLCLSKNFLEEESANLLSFGSQMSRQTAKNILPVEGSCTKCSAGLLWGDLIRKKKGCYNQAVETDIIDSD